MGALTRLATLVHREPGNPSGQSSIDRDPWISTWTRTVPNKLVILAIPLYLLFPQALWIAKGPSSYTVAHHNIARNLGSWHNLKHAVYRSA
jgi:hypothetical protein